MPTAITKITLSASRNIPFNKLVLSQYSFRSIKAGVSIEQLADDIARTVLQSLNVGAMRDAEGAETDMFEVLAAPDGSESTMCFRRGWFLNDGTGAGKGRQVAGILLDNWPKGCRHAVWVSKSDKLIEVAHRGWWALGQERLLVLPLARFRQSTPIRLGQGILFTAYVTLQSNARQEKVSRVREIADWLGSDFDGVIVFDESHAMQNAAGGKSERGDQAPSILATLMERHPLTRIADKANA
jgi:hypothetical protein